MFNTKYQLKHRLHNSEHFLISINIYKFKICQKKKIEKLNLYLFHKK